MQRNPFYNDYISKSSFTSTCFLLTDKRLIRKCKKGNIMFKKFGFFILLLILVLSACRKDNVEIITTEVKPELPTLENYVPIFAKVNGSLTGFVIDENNEPVSNADISLGDLKTTTDDYGHFFLKDIEMNGKGTFVKVEKEGYFLGSRRFFPKDGAESRVKIQLLEKNFSQSFEAQSGGIIEVQNVQVKFGENSIETNNGNAYNGTVRVAAKYLDPSVWTTLDQMPGNLQGVNELNKEVVLGTYGMIALELESTEGEAIDIADDETVTLTMPVPETMQANAPTEIPLWSFNETYGIWAQEGKAILQDGKYVGELSHFSFWSCDVPYPMIEIDLNLQGQDRGALTNQLIEVVVEDGASSGTGYTDENGDFVSLVPANQTLTFNVLDLCGEIIHTQTVGPFTADTDLGTITVGNQILAQISGELIDCNNDAIVNGVVKFSFDGNDVYYYTNGTSFSFVFAVCNATQSIDVTGIDVENVKQSDVITTDLVENVGQIAICDEALINYVKITVDGVTEVLTGLKAQLTQEEHTFIEVSSGQDYFFGLLLLGNTAGDYSDAHDTEGIYHNANNWDFFGAFTEVTITEFGAPGEQIKGTFSGELEGAGGGNMATIVGEFSAEHLY